MIIIISPAKTIVSDLPCSTDHSTDPVFEHEANKLAAHLKQYTTSDLIELMGISPKLAILNYERFQSWDQPGLERLRAICSFKGEVFNGLKGWDFNEEELKYAQNHLRILSGLFGILKPLDKIKPYRLEMGTEMDFGSLYEFWGDKITNEINKQISVVGGPVINLASKEYYRALNPQRLCAPVITPDFKDLKNGSYKIIAIYAKKARGLMSRFILQNKITDHEEIKAFNEEGYYFNSHLSTPENPVFTREV
ncbi:peroxide stress protein YaaA [Saccharicrinis sp. FJH62]|uniref:peroxide stress protein YaaA n=1 Tax=Saccharicrinis sp. FJH62 TaxID=3344657 RepID=UPI0035D47D9F